MTFGAAQADIWCLRFSLSPISHFDTIKRCAAGIYIRIYLAQFDSFTQSRSHEFNKKYPHSRTLPWLALPVNQRTPTTFVTGTLNRIWSDGAKKKFECKIILSKSWPENKPDGRYVPSIFSIWALPSELLLRNCNSSRANERKRKRPW